MDRNGLQEPLIPDLQPLETFLGVSAVICSPVMRRAMQYAANVARSNAAVLITGESGSGKEIVARAIHVRSMRNAKPWIDINCAALPDHLLESELFGFEKGAFSGADIAKPGMFELAHQGTLFLDEISELSLHSQSKLLRVLDGAPYYRLGGTRKVEVNTRIVAATNADLEALVREGKFRADLFFRINQVRLAVPPLRDRKEDIAPLVELFLSRERPGLEIMPDTLAVLRAYPWPGNVRELKSLITRLAATTDGPLIRCEDLPPEMQAMACEPTATDVNSLNRLEREVIFDVLQQCCGRRDRAAKMLGISRRTLIRRLKIYGVGPNTDHYQAASPATMAAAASGSIRVEAAAAFNSAGAAETHCRPVKGPGAH